MQRDSESDHSQFTGIPYRSRSIGVLVDLELTEAAGGHVKCWQRIAEAAVDFEDRLDLTLYFLGGREATIPLSPGVRYVTLPPRMGTRGIEFLA